MLKLTDINGKTVLLNAGNIAQVTQAGASSQWHGVRAYVRTMDGRTLEIQESVDVIESMLIESAGSNQLNG